MNAKNGNETIGCEICKKWTGHVIIQHLKEVHPKVSVYEYMSEHNAPLASATGQQMLREAHKNMVVSRPKSQKPVWEVFGLPKADPKDKKRRFVNRMIDVYEEPGALTPPLDSGYVFDESALKRVLIALALKERNRIWLHGYSGTGKTQLISQVCARTNYDLYRLQGDTHQSRRQLIGDWTAKGNEMVFQYGIIPMAMRNGGFLLFDEIDHLNPATLVIARSVLEDPAVLTILENGGERVTAHEDFRAGATANTAGAGDESGLFVTARALSVADRQRFSIWARVDYMAPARETSMIKGRFPKIHDNELRRFYQVVKAVREKHKSGEFEESFSPREFINWVEKFFLVGDAMEAAEMCFLSRYQSPAVAVAVSELIKAAFDEHRQPDEIPEEG